MHEHTTTQTTWWIAHGLGEKIHHGQVIEGIVITTGQPNLELFYNRAEWESRLTELGIAVELPEEDDISLEPTTDDLLFTDSVDDFLYEDKEFRHVANPYRREY